MAEFPDEFYCEECGTRLIRGKNIGHFAYIALQEADFHNEKPQPYKPVCRTCWDSPEFQEKLRKEGEQIKKKIDYRVVKFQQLMEDDAIARETIGWHSR